MMPGLVKGRGYESSPRAGRNRGVKEYNRKGEHHKDDGKHGSEGARERKEWHDDEV